MSQVIVKDLDYLELVSSDENASIEGGFSLAYTFAAAFAFGGNFNLAQVTAIAYATPNGSGAFADIVALIL